MEPITHNHPSKFCDQAQATLETLPRPILEKIFKEAIENSVESLVYLTLTCKKYALITINFIDLKANDFIFLKRAYRLGNHKILKFLQTSGKKLFFSFDNNYPLTAVCTAAEKQNGISEKQYVTILNMILNETKNDPEINPACRRNYCIRIACEMGNLDIVKRLLKEPGVNPYESVEEYDAIKLAAHFGHYEIIDFMLQNTEIAIPSDEKKLYTGKSYKESLAHEYIELEEKNVVTGKFKENKLSRKAIESYHWAFLEACKMGKVDIVRRFLQHSAINPSIFNSTSIYSASEHRHLEVVKFLVDDGRADPSADTNLALRYAFRNGDKKMIRLLETSKRVILGLADYNFWVKL